MTTAANANETNEIVTTATTLKVTRKALDAYQTPAPLAQAIVEAVRSRLELPDLSLIVEPSAGEGAFVRAATKVWPSDGIDRNTDILAVEVDVDVAKRLSASTSDLVHVVAGDWLQDEIDERVRMYRGASSRPDEPMLIVGNPPYNLKGDGRGKGEDGTNPTTAEKHVLAALRRMVDDDVLVFLLRLSFLGTEDRERRIFRPYPLFDLWPITPRPSFTGDGGADASEYAAFVWIKGWAGEDVSFKDRLKHLVWTPDSGEGGSGVVEPTTKVKVREPRKSKVRELLVTTAAATTVEPEAPAVTVESKAVVEDDDVIEL